MIKFPQFFIHHLQFFLRQHFGMYPANCLSDIALAMQNC